MSEKRKPTYDLEAFKTAFDAEDKLQIAGSALKSAGRIGFGRAEIVATIQTMRRSHFYKSMTAYADNRLWQDVSTTSRPRPERFTVKFMADTVTEFLLLSFKEKNDDQD